MKTAVEMNSRLKSVSRIVPNRSAIWIAVLAGTIMALGVIALWHEIDHRAHEHAGQATENAVRMNQLLIRQDTDNRLAALDRLAHRWTAAGGKPRREWEADAARYVTDMPGFESIQWIDASMQARWALHRIRPGHRRVRITSVLREFKVPWKRYAQAARYW